MSEPSESNEEAGRQPEEPAVRDEHESTEGGQGPADDGFPAQDVTPDEPDPDMDVNDPFGVGEDREPLEDAAAAEVDESPDDSKDEPDADREH